MSKEIYNNITGVKKVYLGENKDGYLQITWTVLNQTTDTTYSLYGGSNVFFEVKIISGSKAIKELKTPYKWTLSRKTGESSTSYKRWSADDEDWSQHVNINIPANSEQVLYTWIDLIPHFSRTSNGGASFNFKLLVPSWFEEADKNTATITTTFEIPPVTSSMELYYASDFNDEGYLDIAYLYNVEANYKSIAFSVASNGEHPENPIIPYHEMSMNGCAYTFQFTEEERDLLRMACPGESMNVYVVSKTIDQDDNVEYTTYAIGQVKLTIRGEAPILTPTIRDINPITLALTGDENIIIDGKSIVEFNFNAVPSKHAYIDYLRFDLGGASGLVDKTLYDMTITDKDQGTIDLNNPPTYLYPYIGATFLPSDFTVRDSRGVYGHVEVLKNVIKYLPLTCQQEVSIKMTEETKGIASLKIFGTYYRGPLGNNPVRQDNELKLYVRHTQNDGSMGDWVELTDGLVPTIKQIPPTTTDAVFGEYSTANLYEYELEVEISGFDYETVYTFQCKAEDKLSITETPEHTIRVKPVYDWSETDFNFNVPVVLQKDLEVKGNSNFNTLTANELTANTLNANEIQIQDKPIGDYVVEAGTEEMETTAGTWYWRKWASGRADCWGCSNYGNMAVSTAYGSLYKSNTFRHMLPFDLFIDTPDVINISIQSTDNYGGWVAYDTNPANYAYTNGFIIVRPAAANLQQVYISFNVIGRWK